MKIKITEPTRLHLEYLLGKDEKAWAQTIERGIGKIKCTQLEVCAGDIETLED